MLLLSSLLFSLTMLISPFKAQAVGCEVSCAWSSCSVSGCSSSGCGCYFGLALCKCEPQKVVIVKVTIQKFSQYVQSLPPSSGLYQIANLLETMPEDPRSYYAFAENYINAVNSLSEEDKSLLLNFLF